MADGRIKDLNREITDFSSGDFIVVDGNIGSSKMAKDSLLKVTAQKALAGNVAQAFDPTRDEDHKYLAGESVAYNGKTYTFIVDHYGAWNASHVEDFVTSESLKKIDEKFSSLSIVDKVEDVNLYGSWEMGSISDGSDIPSQYAMRSKGFYDCADVNGNQCIAHLGSADYLYRVVVYSSAGVYSTSTQRQSANLNLSSYGNNKKYRLVISKADSTTFSTPLTDEEANAVSWIEKRDVVFPANVDGADELLDEVDQKIQDAVDPIDEKFNNLTIMSLIENVTLENSWTPGSISNGVDINSDYAYRTGFYDCSDVDGSQVTVKLTDSVNYGFKVVIYDSNGVYQTAIQRQFADLNMSSFGNRRKYRITLFHRDDSKFTTPITDEEANAIVYIEKNGVVIPPNVAGADELLNVVDQKIAAATGGAVEPFQINKIAFIGSSSVFKDKFQDKVVESFGLTNDDYENYGLSGYGAVDYVRENKMDWWGGCSDCQVCVIWISSNDFAEEQDLGDADSTDTTNYTGALRAIFNWWSGSAFDNQLKLVVGPLQRWGYTQDPIPNTTMTNGKGITLKQYSDRLMDVAHEYGISTLDLFNEGGLNPINISRLTNDGLHPKDAYYDRVGLRIAKAIKNKCV